MPRRSRPESLEDLLDELPDDLRRQAFTHASWVEHRAESYERLAFLGDVVLSLAVSTHLYPALRALRRRPAHQGARPGRERRLVRSRGAPGSACRTRCARPRRRARPGRSAEMLVESERVLASVCEAVIGAAYLAFGFERTAPAVVESFAQEIDEALEHPVDYKSVLQERLARRAEVVAYRIDLRGGPGRTTAASSPSRRSAGQELGRGEGKTKKGAEQEAALAGARRRSSGGLRLDAPALDLDEGLQVLPAPDQARVRHRRVRDRRPERLAASRTSPTPCCGRSASSPRWPCAARR